MSKISEYIGTAVGYDSEGGPASTSQFVFGYMPFQIAENENIEDVTDITVVCHSDAIVDIQILDEIAMVSFDFTNEPNTLAELIEEIETYRAQITHVTNSINNYMDELALAERNADEEAMEAIQANIRALSIPFLLPTIMPVCFGGTVQIGFADDPKFVLFTSDYINSMPSKITMIFDVNSIFCRDDVELNLVEDADAEIEAQQEALWYMEETRKLEEENYQSQFGSNNKLKQSAETKVDKRLKGARIK